MYGPNFCRLAPLHSGVTSFPCSGKSSAACLWCFFFKFDSLSACAKLVIKKYTKFRLRKTASYLWRRWSNAISVDLFTTPPRSHTDARTIGGATWSPILPTSSQLTDYVIHKVRSCSLIGERHFMGGPKWVIFGFRNVHFHCPDFNMNVGRD